MRLFRFLLDFSSGVRHDPSPSTPAAALRTYLVAAANHLQGWALIVAELSEAEREFASLEELEAGAPYPKLELPRVLGTWSGGTPLPPGSAELRSA